MNKKHVIILICGLIIILVFINILFKTKFGIYYLNYMFNGQELSKDEKEWIIEHGSIIYGADENSPPLMFVDEETGQYTGFTIDYMSALSIEIGAEIKHKSFVWNEALKKLADGETDICDMFPSKERAKLYDFSKPIYSLRSIIMVSNNDKEIYHIEDLKGKKVAIPKGDYGIEFLNEKLNDINYMYTSNVEEAVNKVIKGEADALLGDEPVVTYYIEKQNKYDQIRILDDDIYELDVVLAVPKGNKMLINILNKGINSLNRKQTIAKIQQKWFGFSNAFTKEKINEKIISVIIILVMLLFIIMYFSYMWNNSLKREVMKRTEELSMSKNELQITFDGITNLLIVIDNCNRIIDANSSFLKFMKMDRSKVIGKEINEIYRGKISNEINEIIGETFLTQSNTTKELKYDNKIYLIKTYPFKRNKNELYRAIMMIEDVTNERIMEHQMLHSSKMAAIGQLAAGVAHEIRNPLGLIRTYTYILKKKIDTENEDINKSIKIIGESVERSSNIIDNLLNFSRIFDEKSKMTNIKEFIEDIIHLEKRFMEKRKVECKINCDTSINILINRESLKHIIINLVGNAIDAMPNGGRLVLTAQKNKNIFEFICEDTGVGISEADMESIFNPFYTKKVNGKGIGLGLYVIYNEIQKHGGKISVDSKLNVGTRFTVLLPLKEESIESV